MFGFSLRVEESVLLSDDTDSAGIPSFIMYINLHNPKPISSLFFPLEFFFPPSSLAISLIYIYIYTLGTRR